MRGPEARRSIVVGVLVFLVATIVFGIIGLALWASSDLPIIQREIAMNTRKDGGEGSPYNMVKILSVLYKILALVIWVVGLVVAIGGLVGGGSMMNGFL